MGDTSLRIAVLQDQWFPVLGGGAISVLELYRNLVEQRDVTVDIYTRSVKFDGENYTADETIAEGLRVRRLPPCTDYWHPVGRASYFLTPLLYSEGDYDLIHVHSYLSTFPGKLMSKLSNIPVVFTLRGVSIDTDEGLSSTEADITSRVRKRIERFVSVEMDYDTVISVNKQFVNQYGRAHREIRYIPNGVDTARFEAEPPTDAADFLFVGRLVGQKRVSDLLQSFAEVHRSHEETTLTLVGEGPLESELRREAVELGLDDCVEFAGRMPYDEMPDVYRNADVFVLPSVWEGHPRVMLEAWSSSRPVIGTAVSGIEEFIDDGETGWLVPSKDESALAERMQWCVVNPDEVKQAGRAARNEAVSEYSWSAIADKTLELYEELV